MKKEQQAQLDGFKLICTSDRREILNIEATAREVAKSCFDLNKTIMPNDPARKAGFDPSEAGAQAMLAVRHLEDARMRLGKVLQYLRDGVSSYDKEQLP